jgi:putative hydrolase of the HAD superfamily
MLKDILPAQKAGFKTILFAGDRRSLRMRQTDEQCQGIVPDRIMTHLKMLPVIIRA